MQQKEQTIVTGISRSNKLEASFSQTCSITEAQSHHAFRQVAGPLLFPFYPSSDSIMALIKLGHESIIKEEGARIVKGACRTATSACRGLQAAHHHK
jgi:hypothetical protein